MTMQSISPLRGETIVTAELFPTLRFVNLMEQLAAAANLTISLQKQVKELKDKVDAL